MMRVLYTTFLIFFFTLTFSAQKTEDSLREVIKTSSNDSIKIIAYANLANELLRQPKSALELLSEMALYSEKIKSVKNKALCLRKIGAIYSFLNYFDKALEYTYKAADMFEAANDKYGLAYCYNNIGNFYNYKGEFTKDNRFQERSIEYHLKSISLRDTLKDSIPLMNSYNNIGNSYMALGNYQMALKYFDKAYAMFVVAGIASSIEMINLNIGNCYLNIGTKEKKAMYYKKALYHYLSALKVHPESDTANKPATILTNIGHIYSELGNTSLGISYLQRGLEAGKKSHNKSDIMDAANKLSKAYEQIGECNKALELMHVYNANKDSLINEKNSNSIEEMQVLYKSSQKDKEIDKLNSEKIVKDAELSRQRTIIFSTIGAVVSILVLVLVLWSRYNLKKKANQELGDAYKKIELKNQQITDSINYSKRIQSAILPPTDLISQHLKNFFIYYSPKDIVSGDFYWFSEQNNRLYFIVVDCTGHGVPGALMSMIGNTLLNEIINQKKITEPGEILNQLNKGVKNSLRQSGGADLISQDDGMDVSVCCIDKKNPKTLNYACANHSIFVKTNNQITELTGDIFSIGGDFGATVKTFENKTHPLEYGSFVVMSTDGYYDQFGGERDSKYLISRFEDLILKSDLTGTAVAEEFDKVLLDWKGLQKQTDDILVAGFMV